MDVDKVADMEVLMVADMEVNKAADAKRINRAWNILRQSVLVPSCLMQSVPDVDMYDGNFSPTMGW